MALGIAALAAVSALLVRAPPPQATVSALLVRAPPPTMGLGALFKRGGASDAVDASTVAAHMTPNPITLTPGMPLSDAAQLLVDKDITGAPVVDEGALVGVLSQFDFLYKTAGSRSVLTAGTTSSGGAPMARSTRYLANTERLKKAAAETVRDAMTPNPMTISADSSMQDAAAMMLKQKFNRLLVESEGKLVGILSTSDVMRLVLSGQLELS